MILKNPSLSVQENPIENLDNSIKKYPTLDDLMSEQNITSKKVKTVHRRRDLDSLG